MVCYLHCIDADASLMPHLSSSKVASLTTFVLIPGIRYVKRMVLGTELDLLPICLSSMSICRSSCNIVTSKSTCFSFAQVLMVCSAAIQESTIVFVFVQH